MRRFRLPVSVARTGLAFSVALCVPGLSPPTLAAQKFTAFDPQQSGGTVLLSINNDGEIVGIYYNLNDPDAFLGFVRSAKGDIKTLNGRKKEKTSGLPPHNTSATSINGSGLIVGYYHTPKTHGFVRGSDGTITVFDPSGSTNTNPKASTSMATSPAITKIPKARFMGSRESRMGRSRASMR